MADTGLDAAQIRYMRDVLGIRSFVLPSKMPLATSLSVAQAPIPITPRAQNSVGSPIKVQGDPLQSRLVALFALPPKNFPLSDEARDLASKMLQAMKVNTEKVTWIEWLEEDSSALVQVLEILSVAKDSLFLAFGENTAATLVSQPIEAGQWIESLAKLKAASGDSHPLRIMPTHSLQLLIENPGLKKSAWGHLQTVMREL